MFELGLDSDIPMLLGELSNILFGTHGGQLVGVKNANQIVRTDLESGAVTKTPIPSGLTCESGAIAAGSLYLACMQFGLTHVAGMIVLDLDANTVNERRQRCWQPHVHRSKRSHSRASTTSSFVMPTS